MSGLLQSFWSDITCGAACWEAREDVCRCSCGGKNHGIHRRGGTAERTAKIDGLRYTLLGVGTHRDLLEDAEKINGEIVVSKYWDYSYRSFKVHRYDEKERGAAARLKYATDAQIEKWAELAAFKGKDRYHSDAALLWARVDLDAAQANSVQIPALELEVAAKMKAYSLGETSFVWKKTQARLIGAQPISENRFWTKPDFYLELDRTIREFSGEIPKHASNTSID